MNDDLISRQAAIDRAVPVELFGRKVMFVAVSELEMLSSAQQEQEWSGLYSEPEDDNSVYGEKLMKGDTIYLLGIKGTVCYEYGVWGWGSNHSVPWEQLESNIPHKNSPCFCYCDNFVSFWELKWNFDDGYVWDGVPFIRHNNFCQNCGAEMTNGTQRSDKSETD